MPLDEKVLVAVPAGDGMVTSDLAFFFAEITKMSFAGERKFAVSKLDRIMGYSNARNRIVGEFLKHDFTHLWFLDADIIPPDAPELVERMFSADADIVTCLYPAIETMSPVALKYNDVHNTTSGLAEVVDNGDGTADVDATGMGCTLIRRAVLEDKRMHYPTKFKQLDGIEQDCADLWPAVFKFHTMPNGKVLCGEDFDFCIRARRLGYRVRALTNLFCDHVKLVPLRSAMETYNAVTASKREDTQPLAVAK